MEITLKYPHAKRIGYGRLGCDLAEGMAAAGIKVYDGITDDPGESIAGVQEGLSNTVLWVSVPSHAIRWRKSQSVNIFTMWEATILPEGMRDSLHEFDTIIVPSKQNQELFGRYHDNVRFCPLAVDTTIWHYTKRTPPGAFFNFLICGSGERKGYDVAEAAFDLAFPHPDKMRGPIPYLIHKSPRGTQMIGGPWKETQSGFISAEDEVALYGRAHCFLAPSRGEGFGLQPLQAMAQGIPTILTGAHGHASFAHLGHPIGSEMVKAGDFMMGDAGYWWEPDVKELAKKMRFVYDHYEDELARADVNALTVARDFSREQLVENVVRILGGEDGLGAYKGDGEWYTPDPRLYPVVTLRDWKAEISEKILYLKKGEQQWVSADQKRVLYDAGVLDPVCIESEINRGKPIEEWVDTGLLKEQLKHYGVKRDSTKVCSHCNQIIGSGLKASDVIFDRLEREAAMV